MTYSEEQYNALLAVCRSYKNDYDNAFERLKAQQREINALQEENANLTVENEVLQSEKENLMRTVEEGREEIESARKETAKEIFKSFENAFSLYYPHGILTYDEFQNRFMYLAKQYGVEVEE